MVFNNLEVWAYSNATCNNCCHRWVAVWPLGTEDLECPRCGSTDTEREDANEP